MHQSTSALTKYSIEYMLWGIYCYSEAIQSQNSITVR